MIYLFKIILNSELCYDSLFVKNKVKYLNNDFMLNDKQLKYTDTIHKDISNTNNTNNNISNTNICNKYNLTLIALKERTLDEKLRIIKILKRNQYKIKNSINNTNSTNINEKYNVNVITTNDNKRIKKLIEIYKNIINSVTYVDRTEIVRICDIIENINHTKKDTNNLIYDNNTNNLKNDNNTNNTFKLILFNILNYKENDNKTIKLIIEPKYNKIVISDETLKSDNLLGDKTDNDNLLISCKISNYKFTLLIEKIIKNTTDNDNLNDNANNILFNNLI